MTYPASMTTPRDVLLTLLAGAIPFFVGMLWVRLPAERQERLKRPFYVACGLGIAVGVGIMVVGVLGGFD